MLEQTSGSWAGADKRWKAVGLVQHIKRSRKAEISYTRNKKDNFTDKWRKSDEWRVRLQCDKGTVQFVVNDRLMMRSAHGGGVINKLAMYLKLSVFSLIYHVLFCFPLLALSCRWTKQLSKVIWWKSTSFCSPRGDEYFRSLGRQIEHKALIRRDIEMIRHTFP